MFRFVFVVNLLTCVCAGHLLAQEADDYYRFQPGEKYVYSIKVHLNNQVDAKIKASSAGTFEVHFGSPHSSQTTPAGKSLPALEQGIGIWLDNQHLLTSPDLVRHPGTIQVRSSNGSMLEATSVQPAGNESFGLVKVKTTQADVVPMKFAADWHYPAAGSELGIVAWNDGAGEYLKTITTGGSPGGYSFKNGKLQINQFVTLKANIPFGSVGAPVLDSRGQVQGLLRTRNNNRGPNSWVALLGYEFRRFIQDNGFEFQVADESWPAKPLDIAERIAQSWASVRVTRASEDNAWTPIRFQASAFRNYRGHPSLHGLLSPISSNGNHLVNSRGTVKKKTRYSSRSEATRLREGVDPDLAGFKDDPLPFLLGPVSTFLFEEFPGGEKSWSTEQETKIGVMERGRFSWLDNITGDDRLLLTLVANTTKDYLLDRTGNLICEVELKTSDSQDRPRFHLKGRKRIRMEPETGMPGSVNFDGTFIQNLADETSTVRFTLEFRRLTGEALKSHNAVRDANRTKKAAGSAGSTRQPSDKPKLDDAEWKQQFDELFEKAKSGKMVSLAHTKLMRMDPRGGNAELVRFLLENRHDRRYSSGWTFRVVEIWATPENNDLIEEVLADPDVNRSDRRRLQATAKAVGANSEIEAPQDPNERLSRLRARRSWSPAPDASEADLLKSLQSGDLNPMSRNRALISMLEKGTGESLSALQQLLDNEDNPATKAILMAVIEQIRWRQKHTR